MEYLIKDYPLELIKQRSSLIEELKSLNENLPNYKLKVDELSMQISKIDTEVNNYFYILKDLEYLEKNNDHNLELAKINKTNETKND